MDTELSEEEVFANDIDPLDAIRKIRKEEGVADEDLPPASEKDDSSQEVAAKEEDGADELDNLDKSEDSAADDKAAEENTDEANNDEADPAVEADKSAEDEGEDESDESDKEKVSEAVKRKFTADGKDYEFTEAEMLEQFEVIFGQAVNFTQKTQKMAPFRKMISALEEESISAEQLNVAIDALKGNPQALKKLMDANNVEAFDVTNSDSDENDSYKPTDYGKNEQQLSIDEITDKISGDEEYKITVDVIDKQWDDNSRDTISSNPRIIQGLHNDIKSGVYDKVAPVAMKMKVLDGNTKSDLEYYMLAGEKVLTVDKQNSEKAEQSVADKNKEAQDADDNFDQASSEAQRKRSSSSTRQRSDRKGVVNYLDDDDEAFDAWYKNLQASN